MPRVKKLFEPGEIVGEKEIINFAYRRGENDFYKVKCLKCGRIMVHHRNAIAKRRECCGFCGREAFRKTMTMFRKKVT